MNEWQIILDKLVKEKGLIVSFVYGECGCNGILWTVTVLNQYGEEFEKPFAAYKFQQAVEIAEIESSKRGWI